MTKREFDVVDSQIAVEEAKAQLAYAEREFDIVTIQANAKRDRVLLAARDNIEIARWKLEREEAALRMCQAAADSTFDS